jgi:hypothetical protein
MEKKFPANNYFRLKEFIAYVSHVSPKGQAVGYVFYEGLWWGPVSWNKMGRSALNRAAFDVQDGKFQASNCLFGSAKIDLNNLHPIKDLLLKLKERKETRGF